MLQKEERRSSADVGILLLVVGGSLCVGSIALVVMAARLGDWQNFTVLLIGALFAAVTAIIGVRLVLRRH